MTSGIRFVYAMFPSFRYPKMLANTTAEWCGVSGAMGIHYGNTSDGIPPVAYTIQPMAAIMNPIPKISLILIFRNPLWYFIDYIHLNGTWQTSILLMSV